MQARRAHPAAAARQGHLGLHQHCAGQGSRWAVDLGRRLLAQCGCRWGCCSMLECWRHGCGTPPCGTFWCAIVVFLTIPTASVRPPSPLPRRPLLEVGLLLEPRHCQARAAGGAGGRVREPVSQQMDGLLGSISAQQSGCLQGLHLGSLAGARRRAGVRSPLLIRRAP